MNTIAIDCGASFVKAAVFDETGKIISQFQKTAPAVHSDENIFSVVQISALVSLVKSILEDLSSNKNEVKLCISNEMHGFILAYKDGTPFTDYISWQKEFGSIVIEDISAVDILSNSQFEECVRKSGMGIRAGLPSSNLLYLIRAGQIEKANERLLYFYTLGDYLVKSIFEVEPICHPTNAAGTGLYNIEKGTWNNDFIELLNAKDISFPMVGEKSINSNFQNCLFTIFPAVGDQQAALLGAGLNKESDLSFNLGTGAQVSRLTKYPDFSNKWQIRPFFNGVYLKTIPHLPSGRAINVFVRFIKSILNCYDVNIADDKLWTVLLSEEKKCQETRLTCDLSFFQNPITNNTVGSLTNIEEYGLSIGSLFKTVFSQMAENFLKEASFLVQEPNEIKRIIFSGGVARRIDSIRELIIEKYKNALISPIVKDETLTGLYKYSKIIEESAEKTMNICVGGNR